ncbi:MAG: DUF3267 domain-containing protein [Chloroflexi bacterium]|nr:DUF3267 domain-containing protein [Chloroflexota bacterium]
MVTMNPVQTLPENYQLSRSIDLSKDRKLAILLNLVGAALFILMGWFFLTTASLLRTDQDSLSWTIEFSDLLLLLLAVPVVILLHELVHGLFFWVFTRHRPRFGVKALYAYAAAPDWFIPRGTFIWVALSPLVTISLLGLLLLPLLPAALIPAVLLALTANAAGAVGDLFIVFLLLTRPAGTLIRDRGDVVDIFQPSSSTAG